MIRFLSRIRYGMVLAILFCAGNLQYLFGDHPLPWLQHCIYTLLWAIVLILSIVAYRLARDLPPLDSGGKPDDPAPDHLVAAAGCAVLTILFVITVGAVAAMTIRRVLCLMT